MNYLSVNAISKSYGIKTLFDDVTFGIEKGDKTALIATNGSGKSTMLKILVGQETPDSGTITYANDIKIGYLEQLPVYPAGTRVSDLLADLSEEQHLKARQYLTRFSLNDLEQSVYGNKDHWKAMLAVVEEKYPDLWETLGQKHPDLDEDEKKSFILSHFKVSRQEEADYLGTTVNMVDKLRGRRRRKMEDDLT